MVEGGMKCVKYLLFAFNLIFFLAGLGLIITGAVVQTRFSTYFDFFGGSFSAAAILLMVVGGVIFVIGFFGCCGAYKENYCMTMTFACLLVIIFVIEIAAAIAAYVMRNKVKELLNDGLVTGMKNYDQPGHIGVNDAWNKAQQEFECCGVNNYTDWGTIANNTNDVPDSCCLKGATGSNCGAGVLKMGGAAAAAKIYTIGCIQGFEDWVNSNILIIGGVGIGLAIVQLFGVLVACCLASAIRKEYQVV